MSITPVVVPRHTQVDQPPQRKPVRAEALTTHRHTRLTDTQSLRHTGVSHTAPGPRLRALAALKIAAFPVLPHWLTATLAL